MKKFYSYLLASLAMMTMVVATGCKDPKPEPEPEGTGAPEISVAELDQLATVRTASIKVSVKNADKFKYAYYVRDARPTDIKWEEVAVEKDGDYQVDIKELPINEKATIYTFEAFACLKDAVTKPKTVGFKTLEAKPVMVRDVRASSRAISFVGEIVPEYCEAFCYQIKAEADFSEGAFLDEVKSNYVAIVKETGVCTDMAEPGRDYVIAVQPIKIDDKGEFAELVGSVMITKCKTPEFELGQKDVAVTLAIDPATIGFGGVTTKITRPDANVKGFIFGFVTKEKLGALSVEDYITSSDWLATNATNNFVLFVPDAEGNEMSYKYVLDANEEYVIFAIASDTDGFVGKVASATVKTSAVTFGDPAKVVPTFTMSKEYAEVAFEFKENCERVYYVAAPTSDGLTKELATEKLLENVKFGYECFVKGEDEFAPFKINGLQPETDYEIYLLPMSDKGNLGELMMVDVKTLSDKIAFDSEATMSFVVGQHTESGKYGWTIPCTPTLATGAVSWEYGVAAPDDYDLSTGNVEGLAQMLYSTGAIMPATEIDGSLVATEEVLINYRAVPTSTKDHHIVFIPIDKDGAKGKPVVETVTVTGRNGSSDGGADPKSRR